jgi:hypothetical protein
MTTATLVLAYSQQDAALAGRLEKDLRDRGYVIKAELSPNTHDVLIALISSVSNADSSTQAAIIQALDSAHHVIPVQVTPAPLPALISHLSALDFSNGYPLNALLERINTATSPDARLPLKVLTPSVRRANRSTGTWLAILAVIWFIIGIVMVGFFGIQAPREEYNGIDTEVAATIDAYLSANLPHTTEEAAHFPATLQAAPTAQRPYLEATATAMVAPK